MSEKPINVYNMGEEGVNVDVDDVHLRDGELRTAQNMQIDPAGGIGGVRRRDGMATFSSGISGSLTGMIGLPLPDRSQLTRRFYAAMDQDDAGRWRTSTNGTTWSDTGANGMEIPRRLESSSDWAGLAAGSLTLILGASPFVQLNNKLYYAGSDYTQGTTLPTIHVWDGTTDYQISEIPISPSNPTDIPEVVTAMAVYNENNIIVASWDGGAFSRIFLMDTTTGAMSQLAPETVITTIPFCFTVYQGAIYMGLINGSGGSTSTIRYTRPGDATWTTDFTTTSATGYVVALQVFKGKLYAGLAADSLSNALIKQRDSEGTWTTVRTSASTDPINFYGPFILTSDGGTMLVFEGTVSGPGATPVSSILSTTDGSAYSTDYDIEANISNGHASAGCPIRDTNGDIYWVVRSTGVGDRILKRTAAGSWSSVDTDDLSGPINFISF